MDRSPHSDFVYVEAMFQQGFINKNSKLNLRLLERSFCAFMKTEFH